jgi:hypothetical protein
MTVQLPLISLRDYQIDVWNKLHAGINKAILIWHRRAGKDLFCLNYMISRAIMEVGNYWFILPEAQQVRKAIWEGVTNTGMRYLEFFPKDMVLKQDDQSMSIHLKHPDGGLDAKGKPRVGSIISFVGGDRYDKRVGAGIKGAVISEWALQKPNLYDLALEPMLRETKGWVLFNSTPRGENHCKDTFDWLEEDDKYFANLLTIEDTKTIVTQEDVEEERRRGKAEELIQQEYYCSFEGAIQGSYYGDILKEYKQNVMNVPYDANHTVQTMWDLGVSDSMAIWFIQIVGREVRVIDYYEASGYGLKHYADMILNKDYTYSHHRLPHDGAQRQLTSTERALTIEQQLRNLGLNNVIVTPRTKDVYNDIQAVRGILSRCVFDKTNTKSGYECLKQYRREFDEKRNCFQNRPLHDWTSHGADAFRILPSIVNLATQKVFKPKRYGGAF